MLISVIVPVYNSEKYLDRCVWSLLNQTLNDIEIILVDDGSDDSSPSLCDEYANSYEKIKVIHKANEGAGPARNCGINAALGDYIGFVDSDDYIDSDFYEELCRLIRLYDADVAVGGMVADDNKSREGTIRVYERNDIISRLLPAMLGYDKKGNNFIGISNCKCLFRRELLQKHNIRYLSERNFLSEDTIFDISFYSRASRAVYNTRVKYHYCTNPKSTSHIYIDDKFERAKNLYLYELDAIKQFDDYGKYLERIQSMFITNARVALKQKSYYMVKNKKKNRKAEIIKILNDEILQEVIKEYDYSLLPFKQKIMCVCIKHTLWRTAFTLSYMQQKKKSKSVDEK